MENKGFASVNGANIFFETKGQGEPILFVHGMGLSSKMWEEQFEHFSKTNRVIRFDLRGFGKTEMKAEDFTNYDDMKALLDELQIEKAHVVGLSFGGFLATEFTIAYPEKVKSLTVCVNGLGAAPSEERKVLQAQFNEAAGQDDLEKALEIHTQMWLYGPGQSGDRIKPEVITQFQDMIREYFNTTPAANGKPKFLDLQDGARLAEIKVPILVINGELDFSEIRAGVRTFVEKGLNVQEVILPQTAHMVNMEDPAAFNSYLEDFLKTID
jgi:3-oxoadipate enol-lactonase